jgi:hypothetical protein
MARGTGHCSTTSTSPRGVAAATRTPSGREQTGDPSLDAAIEAFKGYVLSRSESYEGDLDCYDEDGTLASELHPVEKLRDGAWALGICDLVADQFARFCQKRGLAAYSPDNPLPNGRNWPQGVKARYLDLDGELFDVYGPARTNYYAKVPKPGLRVHQLTFAESADGQVFTIDFSASQYGFSEFPLVQRLGESGRWQRRF